MPAYPSTVEFVAADNIPVQIVRSKKRRKTISSYWRENKLVVQVPATLDEKTERSFVDEMLKKYRQKQQKKELGQSDSALEQRAAELDQFYFDGAAAAQSVRWVTNQNKRLGFGILCTTNHQTVFEASADARMGARLRSGPRASASGRTTGRTWS